MQELAELLAKLALNHTHAIAKFAAPAVSEYCRAKVWVRPEPELGVTESAVTASTGGGAAAGTVQLPRVCQPLLVPPTSAAHM